MYRIKIQLIALTILHEKKCWGVLSSDKNELVFPSINVVNNANILDRLRKLLGECFSMDEAWFKYKPIDILQGKDEPRHKKDTIYLAYMVQFPNSDYVKGGSYILPSETINNELLQKAVQSI